MTVTHWHQIEKFPQDATTSGSGDKFWSGSRRFPTPHSYDPANEFHALFVTACANILAAAYGVAPSPDTYVIASAVLRYHQLFAQPITHQPLCFPSGHVPSPRELLPEDHEWRQPAFINHIVAGLPVPERGALVDPLETYEGGGCPP